VTVVSKLHTGGKRCL